MRRGFRLAGFPTGRREQESGFLPAWENRSPARAHARKESRACEEWRRKRQGARLAHRSRAGVRGTAKKKTRQTALRTSAAQKAASRVMSLPTQTALRRDGACALCPPQARDFCRPGKTEARRGPAPGNNRVRARRGEGTNTVRDLLGAAARIAHRRCARRRRGLSACPGKQKPCAGTHPETTACVRDAEKEQTRSANCPPQVRSRAGDEASCADDPAPGGFCPAGFLPAAGNRRQAFSPARENRSPAWARTRKQPRACETRRRNKHGARLARRSRATSPPQVRSRAGELGKGEL